jgi:hypothetical protein
VPLHLLLNFTAAIYKLRKLGFLVAQCGKLGSVHTVLLGTAAFSAANLIMKLESLVLTHVVGIPLCSPQMRPAKAAASVLAAASVPAAASVLAAASVPGDAAAAAACSAGSLPPLMALPEKAEAPAPTTSQSSASAAPPPLQRAVSNPNPGPKRPVPTPAGSVSVDDIMTPELDLGLDLDLDLDLAQISQISRGEPQISRGELPASSPIDPAGAAAAGAAAAGAAASSQHTVAPPVERDAGSFKRESGKPCPHPNPHPNASPNPNPNPQP